MIVSGGGWINDSWCSRLNKFFKVMAPVLIASALGVPVRFLAQGVGPINDTKELVRYFFNYLRDNTIIAVRDNYCSESYLDGIVRKSIRRCFLPDDLLFINPALLNRPCHFQCAAPYIAFVINEDIQFVEENIGIFSHFFKKMRERYGVRIVFIPFDLACFGEDQSRLLMRATENGDMLRFNNQKFMPIEEIINCIKHAKLLISGRHHATVIATATRTPYIIKLDAQRHQYAFNKSHGVFGCFLHDIAWCDAFYARNEWRDLFDFVYENYNDIIKYQKNIYELIEKSENMITLRNVRTRYLNDILEMPLKKACQNRH